MQKRRYHDHTQSGRHAGPRNPQSVSDGTRTGTGKISHCYQCLKKCDKASIPYCITTALARAADGDTDNALLFCGENAWRLDHMTTVPELMAELAGEYLPDSKK